MGKGKEKPFLERAKEIELTNNWQRELPYVLQGPVNLLLIPVDYGEPNSFKGYIYWLLTKQNNKEYEYEPYYFKFGFDVEPREAPYKIIFEGCSIEFVMHGISNSDTVIQFKIANDVSISCDPTKSFIVFRKALIVGERS